MIARVSLPAQSAAWATDLHLNFLERERSDALFLSFAACPADIILLSGDISDGVRLETHLLRLGELVKKPVLYVLGNHDRYHTTFAEADDIAARVGARHRHLIRLKGTEVVSFSPRTALVGIDGWGDGTSGTGSSSTVVLNDSIHIGELARLPEAECWALIQRLARDSAERIEPALRQAAGEFGRVIVLTHVPPFPEAAWHAGRTSDPDFLPHFCNARLGETLRRVSASHPGTEFLGLCGHTHGAGQYVERNLTVITAGAEYRKPRIDRLLEL